MKGKSRRKREGSKQEDGAGRSEVLVVVVMMMIVLMIVLMIISILIFFSLFLNLVILKI